MNEQLTLIVLGVFAAAFILRPLLRGRTRTATTTVRTGAPAAPSDELAELELDRSMGRVSEEDYTRWRAELERQAPPVLEPATPAAASATVRAEALVRQWRDVPRPECPNCGQRPEPEARFCSNCGTPLKA
jgi:cytochrome c-type biogenesis protein CcmI